MKTHRLAIQVLAAVLLVAPISFAQYTKVKTIFLKDIQDLWDPLQSQDRDKILNAAREVARSAENMTGHCSYGRDLVHDGKDKILNAQQTVKQQAESVRDKAKALISTIESGGGPRDDVQKTLDEIEKLHSAVDAYMQVVEDTRQWFSEERKKVVALDAELAGRAITENNALDSAEKKTVQLANAWQKASEEATACEETYQKADDKITELTAKRNEEQDPDKAQELTKEIQKWMEEARKLNDKITEAQAKSDRALGEWMQAEKEARAVRQRHAKIFDAMEQIAPTLQRIEAWRVAFLRDFKPTS